QNCDSRNGEAASGKEGAHRDAGVSGCVNGGGSPHHGARGRECRRPYDDREEVSAVGFFIARNVSDSRAEPSSSLAVAYTPQLEETWIIGDFRSRRFWRSMSD